MAKKIAFVGLGGMGRGVVKNIALKGGDVTALDLDREKMTEAEGFGAKRGTTPGEMAADCDVFAVCITPAEAVQSMALGADGILVRMT